MRIHVMIPFLLAIGLPMLVHAQPAGMVKQTFTYAVKDSALQLDLYSPASVKPGPRPCLLFVFGGAFIGGRRDDTLYMRYFQSLADHGYKVASISYRLGLKGVQKVSALHTTPLLHAIDMAVEDLYDATSFLIRERDSLGIDTANMILSGSSSGAITVLEAEYALCNRSPASLRLPGGFRYAGLVAFSGALFTTDGRPKFNSQPAPALFFHGTADHIVPYRKIRLFNKGLFGSSYIAGIYRKKGWPYYIWRAVGKGHEISVIPMYTQQALVLDFIDRVVIGKKHYQSDTSFSDPDQPPMLTISAKDLLKRQMSKK